MTVIESNRSRASLTLEEGAFIEMARAFGHFSDDRGGLEAARKAMRVQEHRVRPSRIAVVRTYFKPQETLSAGQSALGLSDWTTVMGISHCFTEASGIKIPSEAVITASLDFHTAVADRLLNQFGTVDQFLKVTGQAAVTHAHESADDGLLASACTELRSILNVVAHNGTLGKDAQALFSPRSIAKF